MKYLYALPVVGILLVGGFAMAQTVSATHDAAADEVAANDTPAAAPDAAGQPGQRDHGWHWNHGGEFKHRHDVLASLPKPLAVPLATDPGNDPFFLRLFKLTGSLLASIAAR